MPSTPTVTEVARNFAAFINRVALRRERFVLTRGGKPVAELSPVPTGLTLREMPSLVRSLPRLGPEEAESFLSDLEAARATPSGLPASPWDS